MNDPLDIIDVGTEAQVEHRIVQADLERFVDLTGDDNPLHVSEQFASQTPFRRPVVHGMLTASFLSTLIGTRLPGKGALWYEQNMKFLAPARIGETIQARAKVLQKSASQRTLVLQTTVTGEGGRTLIDGQAKVKLLKPEDEPSPAPPAGRPKGAVLITGGAGGIGGAVASRLASDGYHVILHYNRSGDRASRLAEEIVRASGQASTVQADLTNPRALESVLQAAREAGPLDGLVNGACPPIVSRPLGELPWDEVQNHLDVQVRAAFELSKAAVEMMAPSRRGAIVNIGSIAADNVPSAGWTAYNLAKAALECLTRCLAAEAGPRGVRVNCVSPGMTQTDFVANVPDRAKMVAAMQTPMRRLAAPEDVAGVVAFLLSDAAAHITGQNVRVCGGLLMG